MQTVASPYWPADFTAGNVIFAWGHVFYTKICMAHNNMLVKKTDLHLKKKKNIDPLLHFIMLLHVWSLQSKIRFVFPFTVVKIWLGSGMWPLFYMQKVNIKIRKKIPSYYSIGCCTWEAGSEKSIPARDLYSSEQSRYQWS